ncbi:MAG TPA: hypothetical protein EYG85_06140 [Crocinitomix sp.]|nr:hypothetical protein [Crocinitomix sp.]
MQILKLLIKMKKTVIFICSLTLLISCQTKQHHKNKEKIEITKQPQTNPKTTETVKPQTSKVVTNNPNGEFLEVYSNGNIKIQGQNKNGKRDGEWHSYFENGNRWSKTTYKNGIKEGPSFVNYPNGKLFYNGNYKNDVKTGKWVFYKEDGSINYTETH